MNKGNAAPAVVRAQPYLPSSRPKYIVSLEGGLLVAVPSPDGTSARLMTKTFRRGAFDSDESMMAAAVAWRDATWLRLCGEEVPTRSFHRVPRAGSTTGVPGVRYLEKVVHKGSKRYVVPCVIAEVHTVAGRDYRRPSGSRSKLFSLNRFDFDEAVALATAWRAEMVARLCGSKP
jgi:hypothetical protein